jgi:hypothetical protein
VTGSASNVQGPYLFALVADGGLAVNLRTGSWSALNATAAAICGAFQEHQSWHDAMSMVQRRWSMSPSEASSAVDLVRAALEEPRPRTTPDESLPYRRRSLDYALFHQKVPVLAVDPSGETVQVLAPPAQHQLSLGQYFRLVSPKVLAAHGRLVLHAAACVVQGRLAAFVGASGAGKSTTTDLLAEAGATKVADELLVVSSREGQALAYPAAETRIHAWCEEAALTGARRPGMRISTSGLLHALEVPGVPLHRIIALSGKRGVLPAFATNPVGGGEALETLLSASFLGTIEPDGLARHLDACKQLCQLVTVEECSVPDGLERLRAALARYIAKTAS